MREIKFRAQDIASNKWLYGDLRHHKDDVCIFEQGGTKGEQVKAETVGQYIGRIDCEGKPIYEGDIFTLNGKYPKLVKYVDDWHSFCVANLDTITNPFYSRWPDVCKYQQPAPNWWRDFQNEIKVIGNMYDNPEMVKVKEE